MRLVGILTSTKINGILGSNNIFATSFVNFDNRTGVFFLTLSLIISRYFL